MSCDICFESGDLISPCSCSIQVHEKCIRLWYSIVSGKVIKSSKLCCPQCKTPGKAEFMKIFKDDKEVIEILNILEKNKDWTYIVCSSCHWLKKYMQQSCSAHINDTYRLVCSDCSHKTHKKCPNCGILIEKAEGCIHINCICGVHFCWICLKIYNRFEIYNHINEEHMNTINEQLRYQDYLHGIENNVLRLNHVPHEFQTRELIQVAIRNNWKELKYIIEQDKELCLWAVKQNGLSLQFVKDQDREICLEAIEQNKLALQFVKQQTKELCLIAVKHNGYALQFVKNQDKEICLEAVKQNGSALKFVEEQDREICLEAVKNNRHALCYVKNQDREICLEAVRYDGFAFQFVKEQEREICLEAVKHTGWVLKYVHNQDKEICLEAVKNNGLALMYVKEQNKEICSEAVKQNKTAYYYVNMKHIIGIFVSHIF